MIKRALSILLSLTMLLSLVVVPASAESTLEGNQKIKLRVEAQQGEWKYNGSYKGSDRNTYYTVAIFADSELESFAMGKGELYLSFDKNVVAFAKLIESEAEAFEKVYNAEEEDYEKSNLALTSSTKKDANEKGFVTLAFADMNGKTHTIPKGTLLATLRFTVKENVESCSTTFGFRVEGKNTILGADTVKHTVDDSATATVTINGVAPTLKEVTLSSTSVQVDGANGATVNATATSTSNKDITGLVAWSIDAGEGSGVSINAVTGKITVNAKAKAGSYTVMATAIDGKTQGAAQNAMLTVTRALSGYQITVTPASSEIIIPTGETPVKQKFTATAVDRYDDEVTSGFTWSLDLNNIEGVSIAQDGTVTVTAAAKAILNSQDFNVIATLDNSPGKTSGKATLVVKRDSNRVPTSIVISGGASTLAVPTKSDNKGEKYEAYSATVYDQYGVEIKDHDTISWTLVEDNLNNDITISGSTVKVTSAAAGKAFTEKDGKLQFTFTIKATCNGVSGTKTLILTREPAEVTRIAMEDITIAVPKSVEDPVTRSYLEVYDQYDIKMGSPTFEKTTTPNTLNGVTFTDDKITVTSAAAGNTFTDGTLKISVTITCNSASTDIVSETKTITLTRQQSVATTMSVNDISVTVPADDPKVANVDATVRDQYGQTMTDAKVVLDGEQEGFVWEGGKLYVTKAAVKYFKGERKESVTVDVKLKSGDATATAKVTLKLENAQTGPQSAEITGSANIAKPTGSTPNTAVYSISDVIRDQYGLPLTFDPAKLTMTLEDKEDESGFSVKDGLVTLSGPIDGKWTITVTSGAVVGTKYYLKAKYSDMQCAPVMEITITDKAVSGNPLTVVQGDITYGETVNPSVSNKPKDAGAITYTYVGRAGTTYAKSTTKPTNAGKYTVTATCEDANYIYTGSVDFQILPKEIKVDWIELDGTRYTYNGQQQTAKYTVKDKDINKLLEEGTDYTVEGDKQTNAGVHRLKIIGKGNYTSNFTAAAGAPSVNWNIWEATLTVTGADIPAINYDSDFDGALNVNSVTFSGLMNGETLAKGTDYTVAATVGNRNAGTHQVVLTVRLLNGNYKFEQGSGIVIKDNANITVTINKIDHRAEAVSAEGKYGNQLAMDLSQYLEGGSATVDTITDNENILDAVAGGAKAIVQNGKLWLQLTNDSTKVGQRATVTLTVSSTNYNPFTITVTVTVQGKETQTITASDLNVTYGDAGVKLNASALDNAKLAYEVTEGKNVVTVDANGNVTLRKSGTAKIQITAAETEDYGTANTTVTVTVAKRSLTVKANDLTAYVGGQLPALDYTVTGLVSGDTLTVLPKLELKDVPAGVDPMKTAGTYTIGFKTLPETDPYKYDLTVETGTLTVSSRPNVNPVPAGNSIKLEEAAGGKITSSVSRATKGTTVTITVKPDAGYQLEELEVLDKNGEPLPLKELANGKFSFQMPDSKVTVQASFVQESTYAGYPDVLPQDWFYSSVRYVTERGLMNGTPNGFEPNMDSSRATIWTILARFSGVDTTVVSGEWYAVARQWAMENGVSDGTNPNGVITREQLATMLYRFAKNKGLVQEPVTADLSVFVDAGQISDYALDAMRWAVSVGLLNGMDGSRLAPQGSAARAQVAAMLMRFDQLAK